MPALSEDRYPRMRVLRHHLEVVIEAANRLPPEKRALFLERINAPAFLGRVPMRFTLDRKIRFTPELYAAVDRQARARHETISVYIREVLLADLKRSGVRLRPLRSTNKQTNNRRRPRLEHPAPESLNAGQVWAIQAGLRRFYGWKNFGDIIPIETATPEVGQDDDEAMRVECFFTTEGERR